MVTPPPDPFTVQGFDLPAGSSIYRVASNARPVDVFNPGHGAPTRWAFFGGPPVPVLYAAQDEVAAVSETLLHDIPHKGGLLLPDAYMDKVAARLVTRRDLRLASFMGTGLRALQVEARDLTDSDPTTYGDTVQWAAAAHTAGFAGVVWMSKRCNTDRAYVLFGDRVDPGDLEIDPGYARVFAQGPDRDWLIDLCGPLHIEVMVKGA
ncbi:RES family NAD+ phosphorylase [Arthrobacter sp. YAF16]|uniref:RES family NAD+ phosphorylase n=1 Tax=Arthrobacter sp. YAF16 TaxID=3233076 RepID=UPI003F907771